MSGSIQHTIEANSTLVDRSLANTGPVTPRTNRHDSETNATSTRASSDYVVSLSEEAQTLFAEEASNDPSKTTDIDKESTQTANNDSGDSTDESLNEDERQKVEELKARDQEVRTHEQAHASTGGQYAGSPSYSYEQGPDGKRYVTDGEVQIDVSEVAGDPQATIDKMRQVYRAALAPAEPSGADRSVASEARQKMSEATAELAQSTRSEAPSAVEKDTQGSTIDGNGSANSAASRSPDSQSPESDTYGADSMSRSTLEADYNTLYQTSTSGGRINITA